MISGPIDIISPNHLKVSYQGSLSYNKNSCINDVKTESDFWHYDIGANVIPVYSRNKRPYFKWKDYQENPITNKQHEQKKKYGVYENGIAVIAGKIWRGLYKDKHLTVIDLDNKKGIDEFMNHCFADLKTLENLSQKTIVEQHLDDKDKAHVYFIVEIPLINRGGINGTINNSKKDDNVPIIEIKSHGKSFVICSPSIHENGFRYEIIGTKTLMVLNETQSEQLKININKIYGKYDDLASKKLLKENDRQLGTYNKYNGLTPMSELLKEDYISYRGSRHLDLLRVMESRIQRYKKYRSIEDKKNGI